MIVTNRKKAKKELKELKKYLRYVYEKNNQRLYLTSLVEWNEKENDLLDIFVIDKEDKRYLFTVMNLTAFNTLEMRYNFYMKDTGFYEYYDSDLASITPFYFDRTFTLKKFTSITKEDIERCAKYFIEKVLKESWIWDIEFIKP